ncbi:hypothetical protein ACFX2C_037821 [Malus domestica]
MVVYGTLTAIVPLRLIPNCPMVVLTTLKWQWTMFVPLDVFNQPLKRARLEVSPTIDLGLLRQYVNHDFLVGLMDNETSSLHPQKIIPGFLIPLKLEIKVLHVTILFQPEYYGEQCFFCYQ